MGSSAMLRILGLALAATMPPAPCGASPVQEGDLPSATAILLHYDEPAEIWEQALPVGNGRLGAMVFGGTARERIQLNEDTLWTGGPYQPAVDNEGPEAFPRIRQMVFEGRYVEAQNLFTEAQGVEPWGYASYQPLGNLWLDFPGHEEVEDYRRELNLDAGVAGVRYRVDQTWFSREVFSSPVDQVLVVHLSADRPGALTFSARLEGVRNTEHEGDEYFMSKGIAPATLVLQGRAASSRLNKGCVEYQARVLVRTRGGSASLEDDELSVTGADEATLLVAAATSFVDWRDASADPRERVLEQLTRLEGRSFVELAEDHVQEHRRLFRRSDLRLESTEQSRLPTDERLKAFAGGGDPQLAALLFHFGRYLLISSSRPGTQPANLQGIWNEDMNPSWDCKYTTNVNVEMNYWPTEVCNLGECQEPLVRMVEDWSESGSTTARLHYGARGWVQHFNSDIWRVTAPMGEGYFGAWHGAGAWICSHLWEHWLYTGDLDFLLRVHPLMMGAARFYLDTLVEHPEHPWLVTCPSNSPENWYNVGDNPRKWDRAMFDRREMSTICAGPTCDNQMLRRLFDACVEACRVLGVDDLQVEEMRQARDRLPPNQIGQHGQLQEWLEDRDDPENEHRHFTHLWGMYPGTEISLERTPELAAAVKQSLLHRGEEGTGFGLAWQMCLWARMYDAEKALRLLERLVAGNTHPNLFSNCFTTLQVDGSLGATAGIAEMLLQSYAGEIHLLPALPAAWSSGAFRGWRARGGFEVDCRWSEGELEEAAIRSLNGNPCRLRCGEKVIRFTTEPDSLYSFNGELKER